MNLSSLEDVGGESEGVAKLLAAGSQHGHQDRLGMGAGGRAVSAPDFAIDRCGAHGLLRAVVGRVDAGDFQEGEQLVAMLGQVLGQSLIVPVGLGPIQHPIQPFGQSSDGNGLPVSGDSPLVASVAEGEGVQQELANMSGEDGRPGLHGEMQVDAGIRISAPG